MKLKLSLIAVFLEFVVDQTLDDDKPSLLFSCFDVPT